MSIRIGVVTLGVADVARARAFYEELLAVAPVRDGSGVEYFRLDGAWLALYPREGPQVFSRSFSNGWGFVLSIPRTSGIWWPAGKRRH